MTAQSDASLAAADGEPLPRVSRRSLRWFARYSGWYLRRHFHRLYLRGHDLLTGLEGLPLMVCLNHPSWWDPVVALYLSQRLFPQRRSQYAPIAAKGLEKYKIFEKFGFFGIDEGTARGARRFLHVGKSVMARPDGVLWVTAQGRFTDVRERPLKLSGGLGHLASRIGGPWAFVPIALEYAFWEERTPEAFVSVGPPLVPGLLERGAGNAAEWTALFAAELDSVQTELSRLVITRKQDAFIPLLEGKAGVGGIYDYWRRTKATLRGQRFRAEHGEAAARSHRGGELSR